MDSRKNNFMDELSEGLFSIVDKRNERPFLLEVGKLLVFVLAIVGVALLCSDIRGDKPPIYEPEELLFSGEIAKSCTELYMERKEMLDDIGAAFLETNYHGKINYYLRNRRGEIINRFNYYDKASHDRTLTKTYPEVLKVTGKYLDKLNGMDISYDDGVFYCRLRYPLNIYVRPAFLVCSQKSEAELSKLFFNYPVFNKITDDVTTAWILKINANWYVVSPDTKMPKYQ